MIVTTKELADVLGVDYGHAAGFLAVLEKHGQVSISGKRPPPGGKGKPSILYDVPGSVTLQLTRNLPGNSVSVQLDAA